VEHETNQQVGRILILAGGAVLLIIGPLLSLVPGLKEAYPVHALADKDAEFVHPRGTASAIVGCSNQNPRNAIAYGELS
jgi:hypothetical protein